MTNRAEDLQGLSGDIGLGGLASVSLESNCFPFLLSSFRGFAGLAVEQGVVLDVGHHLGSSKACVGGGQEVAL